MHEKKTDYMVLVNGEHGLAEGFEDTVELISVQNAEGDRYQIEKKTYGAFLRLREDLLQNEGLQIDPLFQTVQKKLPKYGFILRYPKDKEAVTKIGYEPWHFRYIDSPKIAREITGRGICFEEYWEQSYEK